MGFQRVDNPLVRSRAESPCRVWDSVLIKPGFQRDNIPLAESRGRAFGGEWGKAPHKAFKRFAQGEFRNSINCF